MKAFLRGLLVFVVFQLAAAAVLVWPVMNYLAAGGQFDPEWRFPDPVPEELAKASAILLCGLLVSFVLAVFGIAWTFLKAWKPFAIALGSALAINGAIVAFAVLDIGPEWLLSLLLLSIPLSILGILYSIFLSLRNNVILITFLRLVGGTALALLISILYPFLIVGVALYLKKKRGMTFREVWVGSADLYNFVVVNMYPIFFQILPEFNYVRKQVKAEEKRNRKVPPPKYQSRLDLDKMKVGDVILSGWDTWANSIPIQASNILSSSEDQRGWTHSMIYAGDGKVIEAQPDGRGVTVSDMNEWYFKPGRKLWVFRHCYLAEGELAKVVDYCRIKADEGCQYDNWGVSFYALAALIPPMTSGWLESPFAEKFFNVSDSYFCSELVAEAFLACGHDIFGRRPWRVKPLDFAHTPLFVEADGGFERWVVEQSPAPEIVPG